MGKSHRATQLRNKYDLAPHRTLLFVGRTVPEKGLHYLVKVMPFVLKKIPDLKLIVVGSPLFGRSRENRYLQQLKKSVEQLGDSVVFTGFVDHATLAYYYAVSDVVVVPSVFQDPLPTVVLEAMALGKVVVGSCRGGIPEMVEDGKTGLLVAHLEGGQELAAGIVWLFQNRQVRQNLGIRARKRIARSFSSTRRYQAVKQVYEDVSTMT